MQSRKVDGHKQRIVANTRPKLSRPTASARPNPAKLPAHRLPNESFDAALARLAGKWVNIKAGSFYMGSPKNEAGRFKNEVRHKVTLTRDFQLKATEVTRAEFKRIMGYDPTPDWMRCDEASCPVARTTWYTAAAYCNKLSRALGLETCYQCTKRVSIMEVSRKPVDYCESKKTYPSIYACPGFRLPTEAEWEYAARAGTTTATYNGDLGPGVYWRGPNSVLDPIAWYSDDKHSRRTRPVAQKKPNPWGLYDMLGNFFEWCHDWFVMTHRGSVDPEGPRKGSLRVVRGGSAYTHARYARAAARTGVEPQLGETTGIRPAQTLVTRRDKQ